MLNPDSNKVYVKYVPVGMVPDNVKETVANGTILPNLLGYRLNGGIGRLKASKYNAIILSQLKSGESVAIDSVSFEVLQ